MAEMGAEFRLETERLVLRQIGEDDVEAHLQTLNSGRVMERLGGPRTRDEIAQKHAKTRASYAEEGFGFLFAYELTTGELVGHCGMKRVDNEHAPNLGDHEIGWLIRDDRWRMGYAEEAVRAIMGWAFRDHDAPHLVALTSTANAGSWNLMQKLGMERRADLDFTDPEFPPEDSPTIQYSITRDRWEAAQ
ncbi:GNAT family N-acetyltransferase [Erythrobacter sp. W53]|uniref:GNAT family N-acetyltransferase n=1 Tax=Erythrobacter sp. W53 TaxID=3425947 RepID=UPI003D76A211